MTVFLVILCVAAGVGIGYFLFDPRFNKKKITVFGTLMIPVREVEVLKEIGDELTIFVGEPGEGKGCKIYAVQGLRIIESHYGGGFDSNTKYRAIWGASFKLTKEKSDLNCIILPGQITEGMVTAAYERSQNSFPRPCLINVVLF
jgi:hypothetical protein